MALYHRATAQMIFDYRFRREEITSRRRRLLSGPDDCRARAPHFGFKNVAFISPRGTKGARRALFDVGRDAGQIVGASRRVMAEESISKAI